MKNLIIVILILTVSIKLSAQTFQAYADTANYLISRIENNKNYYIGKPFAVLYDSLKIKPVRVIPSYVDVNPNSQEDFGKDLRFNFNFEELFDKKHILIVTCPPPPYNIVYPMFYPIENSAPIGDIINLYKPLIIKDIVLKDYQQDDPVDPKIMLQGDNNIPPPDGGDDILLPLLPKKPVPPGKPISGGYDTPQTVQPNKAIIPKKQ
jgi:hypothetical protein